MDLTVQRITYKINPTRMNYFSYAKHLNLKQKPTCESPYCNFKTPWHLIEQGFHPKNYAFY